MGPPHPSTLSPPSLFSPSLWPHIDAQFRVEHSQFLILKTLTSYEVWLIYLII